MRPPAGGGSLSLYTAEERYHARVDSTTGFPHCGTDSRCLVESHGLGRLVCTNRWTGGHGPPHLAQSTRRSAVIGTPSSASRASCSSDPGPPFMPPSAWTTRHHGSPSGERAMAWPTWRAPLATPYHASASCP